MNCKSAAVLTASSFLATKLGGEVLPETVENGRNLVMYRGAARAVIDKHNTLHTEAPVF
jgi:hypothetical protein